MTCESIPLQTSLTPAECLQIEVTGNFLIWTSQPATLSHQRTPVSARHINTLPPILTPSISNCFLTLNALNSLIHLFNENQQEPPPALLQQANQLHLSIHQPWMNCIQSFLQARRQYIKLRSNNLPPDQSLRVFVLPFTNLNQVQDKLIQIKQIALAHAKARFQQLFHPHPTISSPPDPKHSSTAIQSVPLEVSDSSSSINTPKTQPSDSQLPIYHHQSPQLNQPIYPQPDSTPQSPQPLASPSHESFNTPTSVITPAVQNEYASFSSINTTHPSSSSLCPPHFSHPSLHEESTPSSQPRHLESYLPSTTSQRQNSTSSLQPSMAMVHQPHYQQSVIPVNHYDPSDIPSTSSPQSVATTLSPFSPLPLSAQFRSPIVLTEAQIQALHAHQRAEIERLYLRGLERLNQQFTEFMVLEGQSDLFRSNQAIQVREQELVKQNFYYGETMIRLAQRQQIEVNANRQMICARSTQFLHNPNLTTFSPIGNFTYPPLALIPRFGPQASPNLLKASSSSFPPLPSVQSQSLAAIATESLPDQRQINNNRNIHSEQSGSVSVFNAPLQSFACSSSPIFPKCVSSVTPINQSVNATAINPDYIGNLDDNEDNYKSSPSDSTETNENEETRIITAAKRKRVISCSPLLPISYDSSQNANQRACIEPMPMKASIDTQQQLTDYPKQDEKTKGVDSTSLNPPPSKRQMISNCRLQLSNLETQQHDNYPSSPADLQLVLSKHVNHSSGPIHQPLDFSPLSLHDHPGRGENIHTVLKDVLQENEELNNHSGASLLLTSNVEVEGCTDANAEVNKLISNRVDQDDNMEECANLDQDARRLNLPQQEHSYQQQSDSRVLHNGEHDEQLTRKLPIVFLPHKNQEHCFIQPHLFLSSPAATIFEISPKTMPQGLMLSTVEQKILDQGGSCEASNDGDGDESTLCRNDKTEQIDLEKTERTENSDKGSKDQSGDVESNLPNLAIQQEKETTNVCVESDKMLIDHVQIQKMDTSNASSSSFFINLDHQNPVEQKKLTISTKSDFFSSFSVIQPSIINSSSSHFNTTIKDDLDEFSSSVNLNFGPDLVLDSSISFQLENFPSSSTCSTNYHHHDDDDNPKQDWLTLSL